MRLLIIAEDKYPPFRVDVKDLFGRELCAKGYRIDWILQSKEDCDVSYKTDWNCGRVLVGATDNGTSFYARLRKHLLDIRNDLRLIDMIRAYNYDVIQVKDKVIAALFACYAAWKYDLTFVYWLSFPFPEAWVHKGLRWQSRYPYLDVIRGTVFMALLYGIILRRADHIFVQSEEMKRAVARWKLDRGKITPVVMGVSLKEMAPFIDNGVAGPDGTTSDRTTKRILYLGTMEKQRRIDFVIRVFAKLRATIEDVELLLVGGGEPKEDALLRAEIDRYHLGDCVTITGFLPQNKAWECVVGADVCLSPFIPLPHLISTSPTKLIEYMALGKPVVANHHPEQTEVLSKSGAGICVDYDEEAFAEAVLWLLEHPSDARNMGRKGRKYVEEFRDYHTIADMVDRTYRSIETKG